MKKDFNAHDKNGNFLYTKLKGFEKYNFEQFVNKINPDFFSSRFWKNLPNAERSFFYATVMQALENGHIPPGVLLTIAMPPSLTPFKQFDNESSSDGATITFDVPPRDTK